MSLIPDTHRKFLGQTLRYLHETLEVPADDFKGAGFGKELLQSYRSATGVPATSPRPASGPQSGLGRVSASLPLVGSGHEVEDEAMDALRQTVAGCLKCHLGTRRRRFVRFGGAFQKKVLVVTDLPEFYDEVQGRYFSSEDGVLLGRILSAVGLGMNDVHLTGALKCASAELVGADLQKVDVCVRHLESEIRLLNPGLILAFGELTYRLLFKREDFTSQRGKVLKFGNVEVVFTHHPRELLRDPSLKKEAWNDLKSLSSRFARQVTL